LNIIAFIFPAIAAANPVAYGAAIEVPADLPKRDRITVGAVLGGAVGCLA
jgi:hypothetical protein